MFQTLRNAWKIEDLRKKMLYTLLILLIVVIGPLLLPVDLSYQDNTQQNVAPGYNMMKVPKELAEAAFIDGAKCLAKEKR